MPRVRPTLPQLIVVLLGVLAPISAQAADRPEARLVRCGAESCLRLSGHRADASVAVRVAERELEVQGDRDWRITVPLATARGWPMSATAALHLSFVDRRSGTESSAAVLLPPGALARPLQLASLVVRAH